MTLTSKIKHIGSRAVLAGFCLGLSYCSFAQDRSVIADPHIGALKLTDVYGYEINQDFVQPNQLIKLTIPVANVNHGKPLPAGSCKLKIGLGSKMELDPSFDITSASLNSYFSWTATQNSGQLQITGDLVAPLPANFDEVTVTFKVKGTVIGKSTITANFLISNHNTVTVVSDEDGTNNTAFLAYTVSSRPAPASVTNIAELTKTACSVNVAFGTDREINLVRYEVEASKDGINYQLVSTVAAAGNAAYNSSFEIPASLQVAALSVRIKSVERSGREIYSAAKVVNGTCIKLPLQLSLYPNPAKGFLPVNIKATQGIFDGQYRLKMMDMGGKAVIIKDITVSNVTTIVFDYGNIAAGKYLIQVVTNDNVQVGLLKFEKL
jgi:hypothetical protein